MDTYIWKIGWHIRVIKFKTIFFVALFMTLNLSTHIFIYSFIDLKIDTSCKTQNFTLMTRHKTNQFTLNFYNQYVTSIISTFARTPLIQLPFIIYLYIFISVKSDQSQFVPNVSAYVCPNKQTPLLIK